jgi:hypothetical protein
VSPALPELHPARYAVRHFVSTKKCIAQVMDRVTDTGADGVRQLVRALYTTNPLLMDRSTDYIPPTIHQVFSRKRAAPLLPRSDRAKREIMMLAWAMAVKGKSPEYEETMRLIRCMDDLSDRDDVRIFCMLRVRHPFEEGRLLDSFEIYQDLSGMDLVDFGERVTLRRVYDENHAALFGLLVREGIPVTVEANASEVIRALKASAKWRVVEDGEGDEYEAKPKRRLLAWLDARAIRLAVERAGKTGFRWAEGTKFPITLSGVGYRAVIEKKQGR